MTRPNITTNWTKRIGLSQLAVDPIKTGVWDDTQNWDETNKYWLDGGDLTGTAWNGRTTITTNWS